MKKFLFLFALFSASKFNTTLFSQEKDTLKTYTIPEVNVMQNKAIRQVSIVPFQELDRKEIQSRTGNTDLPSLLNNSPSILTYSENGNLIGYSNLTLRGFDQRRISVYINGIPQNDPEDHNVYWINFADIQESLESIQIQRGAGIANYGSPSIAGSINLQTRNLSKNKGISIFTGAGYQNFGDDVNFNNNKYKVEYSSGLVDEKYSFYGKLGNINSFGYRDNSSANLTNWFFSGTRYDKDLTTTVNVYGGMQRDNLAYIGLPKSSIKDKELRTKNYNYWEYDENQNLGWASETRNQEEESFSQPHFEVLNNWKINDNITFNSSLFYYTGVGYFDFSGAGWADTYFGLDPTNGFADTTYPRNSIIRAFVENKHGGWIPTMDIKHKKGKLTIGSELRWHRSDHWGKINYAENLPANYNPDYKFYQYDGAVNTYSIFLREFYNMNEKLTINLEGQLAYKNYKISNEKVGTNYKEYYNKNNELINAKGNLFEIPYLFFNPKAGVNYKLNTKWNVYGMIALTNREPRMNNLYNPADLLADENIPNFAIKDVNGNKNINFSEPNTTPEQMIDIELGTNFTTPDFIFDFNLYLMEFKDELVKNGKLNLFGAPIDANVPKTRHIGVEILAKKMFDTDYGKFTVEANTTISSNKIVDYDYEYIEETSDSTSVNRILSLEGNKIAGFPDYMANLVLQYNFKEFNFMLNAKYVGEMKTDNFGDKAEKSIFLDYSDNTLPDYFVMNMNLSYSLKDIIGFKSLRFNVQVNNLLNELYAPYAVGQEFFPAAERSFFFGIQINL